MLSPFLPVFAKLTLLSHHLVYSVANGRERFLQNRNLRLAREGLRRRLEIFLSGSISQGS